MTISMPTGMLCPSVVSRCVVAVMEILMLVLSVVL